MSKRTDPFTAGYDAFRTGDYDRARRLLAVSGNPQALHLRGLVERRAGNLARAGELLAQAARREPGNHEIAHNRALVALQLNEAMEAERHATRALAIKPDFARASNTLGRALLAQRRWHDAVTLYEALYEADPSYTAASHGLGTALLESGDARRAHDVFDALIAGDADRPEVRFMRGRARLQLGEVAAALDDLRASHAGEPTALTLRELANVLWMMARTDEFDELLSAAQNVPALAAHVAELWFQRGEPKRAVAAAAAHGGPRTPSELGVTALAHIDAGDAAAAEHSARLCLEAEPDNAVAVSALVSALLMQGDPRQALDYLRPMREREPLRQHWLAYEATALRYLDPAAYEELLNLEHLVRAYELPTPPGYASLEDFNAALLAALEHLHVYRSYPLGQSLRGGSQTSRDLRAVPDPIVRAFLTALDAPIREYLHDVGSATGHPLTERNHGGYEFAGCWSVWLRGGGRHVSHVHPEGWISSAYYVAVPPETGADNTHAGWIKFAEPPFATQPPSPAQKWLQPRPGLLVLFPSYLWHGTEPISDQALRVTAPFDLLPA